MLRTRHSKAWMVGLGLVLSLAIQVPAAAAVDMFLNVDGVKGESRDSAHRDEIDILAWSWGASSSASAMTGTPGGVTNAQDFSFTKWVDTSSVDLLRALVTGQVIRSATLTVRKAGSQPLEQLVYRLSNVRVTSVSTGGSGGEDRLTENITLNVGSVEMRYTPQLATGAAGPTRQLLWNITANSVK